MATTAGRISAVSRAWTGRATESGRAAILYHLTKPQFARWIEFCYALPAPNGVFCPTLKEGEGEHCEEKPGPRCPGGAEAQTWLRGELMSRLQGFELLREQRVEPSEGGFELWLRRS